MTKQKNYWPAEWDQKLVKTQNAMGVMFKELSPAAYSFVQYAKIATLPLLDIGAAYGVATIPALKNGAKVIACDLSDEHLLILRQSTDQEFLFNLETLSKKYPDELHFDNKSLSGILISNVLHFMDGESITNGLHKCFKWLNHDDKLFVTVMTPHLSFYYPLIPDYKTRVREGAKWPGMFNPKLVASDKWRDNLPDFVHLFEIDTLKKVINQAGFEIEKIKYFFYQNFPDEHRTDGKEFISLCAIKP
ncbi:class I SAM-dependent methyltransferase [Legionella gresilensis]|uniref:class I SAM-dependent methyltransferase n=1 Tax=Legionella gresilensis TaxID=91823 RepID=UPI001041023C|nr:class I SAM-dependent methyltransferase [Legionella gresilensis]